MEKVVRADFVINGEIKTKQRPRATVRGGFAQIYTPKTTIYYENLVKLSYQQQCNGTYFGDIPLRVKLFAHFKAPEATKKYVAYGYECTVNKDLDNIAKTVLDALNGIAYKDDKQVIELYVSKQWNYGDDEDTEYIIVTIESIESGSLEHAKKRYELIKTYEKINKLIYKPKKTKKDYERLEELKKQYDELSDYEEIGDIEDYVD